MQRVGILTIKVRCCVRSGLLAIFTFTSLALGTAVCQSPIESILGQLIDPPTELRLQSESDVNYYSDYLTSIGESGRHVRTIMEIEITEQAPLWKLKYSGKSPDNSPYIWGTMGRSEELSYIIDPLRSVARVTKEDTRWTDLDEINPLSQIFPFLGQALETSEKIILPRDIFDKAHWKTAFQAALDISSADKTNQFWQFKFDNVHDYLTQKPVTAIASFRKAGKQFYPAQVDLVDEQGSTIQRVTTDPGTVESPLPARVSLTRFGGGGKKIIEIHYRLNFEANPAQLTDDFSFDPGAVGTIVDLDTDTTIDVPR